jgi:hypothetical protein
LQKFLFRVKKGIVIDSNFNDLICFPFENDIEDLKRPDWLMEEDKWPNLIDSENSKTFYSLSKSSSDDEQLIASSNRSFVGEQIEKFKLWATEYQKNFDFKKFYYFFCEDQNNSFQLVGIRSHITYLFLSNEQFEKEKNRIGL